MSAENARTEGLAVQRGGRQSEIKMWTAEESLISRCFTNWFDVRRSLKTGFQVCVLGTKKESLEKCVPPKNAAESQQHQSLTSIIL